LTSLELREVPGRFAVWRLPPDAGLPEIDAAGFLSITRTNEELSIVSAASAVPNGVPCESGWSCLQVVGPLPFELTGILARLTAQLAAAEISVFAVSTYNTDYLLVRADDLEAACSALREGGCTIGV
jgi:hypothetical protein